MKLYDDKNIIVPTFPNKNLIPHNRPTIGEEEKKAVNDALDNLELTKGNKVQLFEEEFSKYIGLTSASTSSGISALHLALNAIGISKNDEVLLPSYTCIAVALPVLYQQAKPKLVDVNEDYNISVDDFKKKITKKTKAVIVPHMFGYPADLFEIKEICEDKDIYLVEDCAQSIDALYHNKKVGTIGDISIFSFYATKMTTSIQGGMVCTINPDWIQTVKDLRYYDQCRSCCDDNDTRIKYSYMMSDVGAAMGIVQLKKLDNFIYRRRAIVEKYNKGLSDDKIVRPLEKNNKKHVYSRYIIRTSYDPSMIREELRRMNIISERMYFPPLHNRELLKKFNKNAKFKMTDSIIKSAISLPIYPTLTDEEIEKIIYGMKKVLIKLEG